MNLCGNYQNSIKSMGELLANYELLQPFYRCICNPIIFYCFYGILAIFTDIYINMTPFTKQGLVSTVTRLCSTM